MRQTIIANLEIGTTFAMGAKDATRDFLRMDDTQVERMIRKEMKPAYEAFWFVCLSTGEISCAPYNEKVWVA